MAYLPTSSPRHDLLLVVNIGGSILSDESAALPLPLSGEGYGVASSVGLASDG